VLGAALGAMHLARLLTRGDTTLDSPRALDAR